MLNILDAIPIFINEKLLYTEDYGDKIHLKIKKYEHYNVFKINKQSMNTLALCNGENTLKQIIDILRRKYIDVDANVIQSDLLEILETLWLLEVIEWKTDHPFTNYFGPKDKEFKVEALSSESVHDIFKNKNDNFIDEPYYDSKYMNKVKNIKDVIILGTNSYYVIKAGDEVKLIYKIMSYRRPSKNSLLFHPIYMKNCENVCPTYLLKCIKWSKNRHDSILKSKTNDRIYCNVDVDLESMYNTEYLKTVGFKTIGDIKIKKSRYYTDFNVFALDL